MIQNLLLPTCWASLIILAYLGLGWLVKSNLKLNMPGGWGGEAALGMGTALCLSGVPMLLSVAKPPILLTILAVGWVGVYFKTKDFLAEGFALSKISFSPSWLLWIPPIMALLSSASWPGEIDSNDDLTSYLGMPLKILQTGTLIEPYSFQRAGTMGGHALLQAITLIGTTIENCHLTDRGIAQFLFFATIWGAAKPLLTRSPLIYGLLMLSAGFIPVPRISTSAGMTGGLELLLFLLLLPQIRDEETTLWKRIMPLAILLTALTSIKPTFTIVAALILAGEGTAQYYTTRSFKQVVPLLVLGVMTLALLSPWMILQTISCGAPLIPPFSGNVRPEFQMYNLGNPFTDAVAGIAGLFDAGILALVGILIVSSLRGTQFQKVVTVCTLLGCWILLYKFSALVHADRYRYIYPILFPACVAGLLYSFRTQDSLREGALVIALLFWIIPSIPDATSCLNAETLCISMAPKRTLSLERSPVGDSYEVIQSIIPPGSKAVATVDNIYKLDFERNPIYNLNFVGATSPHQALKFSNKQPKEVAEMILKHFQRVGIDHLITANFQTARNLYSIRRWKNPPAGRPEQFYETYWKPEFLGYMSGVAELAAQGRIEGEYNGLVVIDLRPRDSLPVTNDNPAGNH
jgi:hypothetical protein